MGYGLIVIHIVCKIPRNVYVSISSIFFFLEMVYWWQKMQRRGNVLGARIATLRRAAGMSQGELAQKLQVSPSAVGMYEQGRREPSADTLVAISRLFHVTLDYLLTGQAAPEEQALVADAMDSVLDLCDAQLASRPKRPLSREELAVLFAALLMDV